MAKKRVTIIDYQLSNLFSVKHACDFVGIDSIISSEVEDIHKADAVILPGVGAFGTAMQNLESLGLVDPIKEFVQSGKPFFGVCLGLQLLFSESEEFGNQRGLDLVSGKIRKFPAPDGDDWKYKVPQIAWNKIKTPDEKDWINTPLENISNEEFMYFVHSFYVQADSSEDILTYTNYGNVQYCSGIMKNNNIFALQFHPEKSGSNGLKIYRNWAEQNNLI